jgi:putative oxidoreductase
MGAMKKVSCIAALLLGLAFVAFGLNFWLHYLPAKPVPAPESFMGQLYSSGYLAVIKALEVIGGVLLILPRTRVLGLFLIGAILFNIACIHQFFFGGLKDPTVIGLIVLTLIVAWSKRYALCCVNTCGCGPAGCCNKEGSSCCSTEKPASTGCCGGK